MIDDEIKGILKCASIVIFFLVAFFLAISPVCQVYNVWAARKIGEAELAHAESNRQIKTLEAKSYKESAQFLADAEITRARGVAEANKIIGDSLKENEGYLRYLWIQGLQTNQMQVIYVPTEANLPLLEATRIK